MAPAGPSFDRGCPPRRGQGWCRPGPAGRRIFRRPGEKARRFLAAARAESAHAPRGIALAVGRFRATDVRPGRWGHEM